MSMLVKYANISFDYISMFHRRLLVRERTATRPANARSDCAPNGNCGCSAKRVLEARI